mmetsp:Transcript_26069/g.57424  ORF Transcript_26069/g.57424 Transcript_26069/m.57424 type:complete len:453 (+) Transcript_26069:75-1433(+)
MSGRLQTILRRTSLATRPRPAIEGNLQIPICFSRACSSSNSSGSTAQPLKAPLSSGREQPESEPASSSASQPTSESSAQPHRVQPAATAESSWGGSIVSQINSFTRTAARVEARYRWSSYVFYGIGGGGVFTAGIVMYNWDGIKRYFSKESAGLASLTIQDKELQTSVGELATALLQKIMTDDAISKAVAEWVMSLLNSIEGEISLLVMRILEREEIIGAVNRLADRLVEYLCSSQLIQEKVGKLLVDAICMEYTRNAAADWAVDLVTREDVLNSLTEMLVTALQREPIVKQSQVVGAQIVDHILRDPQVYFEARKVLSDTLRDSELQVAAKESIWNIILPWGARSKVSEEDKSKQRAIQVVDEIANNVGDMTPEEKTALFNLQARLRAELAAGVSRHSSSSSVPGTSQDTSAASAPAVGAPEADGSGKLSPEEAPISPASASPEPVPSAAP